MSEANVVSVAEHTIRRSDVVALDWDGTLIDSVPYKLAQNQAIARKFGQELSLDEVRTIWNESSGFSELMQNLCGTDNMDTIMKVVLRSYDDPKFAKRPFEFASSQLRKIRALGKKTALITNSTRELLEIDVKTTDISSLEDCFDFIQASDGYGYKKPDPRVFEPMLETLNVEPSQVAYIGDEVKDAIATKRAGMRFIGVESGMATAAEFASIGAFSIRSLGELALKPR